MTFETDDEVRESVAFARLVARMIPYADDYTDDDGDAVAALNRLIPMARAIFADKPAEDDEIDEVIEFE